MNLTSLRATKPPPQTFTFIICLVPYKEEENVAKR